MKRILVLLLLFLYAQAALATSIVILITPQFILIGSDSKRQVLDGGASVQDAQTVTKIQRAGPYCFAMAGITNASATNFSAAKIVAEKLGKPGSYNQALRAIKTELSAALTRELTYQRKHQPAAFRQMEKATSPLLELVILSMHQGSPRMEIVGFQMGKDNHIQVGSYTTKCPGDCPPQQSQVYFMGSYQTMEQQLPSQRFEQNPAQMVENLILEQSKATPASVGGPVRIARFSALGLEWVK